MAKKPVTLLTTIRAFCTSNMKHTATALRHTLAVADKVLDHRDWDAAATLIDRTDPKMSKQVKAILGEVLGGVTMKADAKHKTGMRFTLGDNFGPTEKLEVLRDLVEAGNTLYSDEVNQGLLGKVKAEPKLKEVGEVTTHLEEYAAKHGFAIKLEWIVPLDMVEADSADEVLIDAVE